MPDMHYEKWNIIIEPDRDGGFWASCENLSDCHAFGATYHEALNNIQAKIQERLREILGFRPPPPGTNAMRICFLREDLMTSDQEWAPEETNFDETVLVVDDWC